MSVLVLFRCKSYEKAKKKLTILEAPNVLTIALKRFQVHLSIKNAVLLFVLCRFLQLKCVLYCSLVNSESLIKQFGSLRSWTWHHIWVGQVINHPYTGSMGWWSTWILWMLHFRVTMCATLEMFKTSGSRLMTARYVLYNYHLHTLSLLHATFLNLCFHLHYILITYP